MIDRTLFFQRNDKTPYRKETPQRVYDNWWWTYPGANDPYAPDTISDPYSAYRYGTGGEINKYFLVGKIARDKWLNGKRKRNLISILDTDWTVDTDEALTGKDGGVYDGVEMTQRIAFLNDHLVGTNPKMLLRRKSWERAFAELKRAISGKTWKITTSNDRWFYREGRVEVQDAVKDVAGGVEITADCDPWKYEKYSSQDDWEFDDLDFEYGIIREREDYTLTLTPGESKTVAVFPLEKAEPIYIKESLQSRATIFGNNVGCRWAGIGSFTQYADMIDKYVKTAYVPTESRFVLEVKNLSSEDQVVEVYYRGAIR